MIPNLSLPEYYVRSVDIEVGPSLGTTVVGEVSSGFDVFDPELSSNPEGLACEAVLELELYPEEKAPWNVEDTANIEEFGYAEVQVAVLIPGPQEQLEPYYHTWQSGDYTDVDHEFCHHLESGLVQHIVNPVGDLLDNSFNGVIPRMFFTPAAASDGSGNSDIDEK